MNVMDESDLSFFLSLLHTISYTCAHILYIYTHTRYIVDGNDLSYFLSLSLFHTIYILYVYTHYI